MKRRSLVSLYVGLAIFTACGGGTHPTSSVGAGKPAGQQEFGDATMPSLSSWDHQAPPKPADKQVFLVYPADKVGQWVCVLADYGRGQISWGALIDKQDLADFIAMTSDLAGQLDVGRIPPPPPPPGKDPGKAARLLQRAARIGAAFTAAEAR